MSSAIELLNLLHLKLFHLSNFIYHHKYLYEILNRAKFTSLELLLRL
jgi:hypothetical protein